MKNVMKNSWWLTLIIVVVIGSTAFAGGFLVGKNQRPKNNWPGGQLGGPGGQQRRQIQVGSMVNGSVLAKDDKSLTIKNRDGGSKIVFFAPSTKILKSVEGTVDDLAIGDNVTASGQTNADGSVTAQMIQLRQDMMFGASTTPDGRPLPQGGPDFGGQMPDKK